MKDLPSGVILGANSNAIEGGLKLWETPETNARAEIMAPQAPSEPAKGGKLGK